MASPRFVSPLIVALMSLVLVSKIYGQAGAVVGEDYTISPGDVVTLSTFDDPKGSPASPMDWSLR